MSTEDNVRHLGPPRVSNRNVIAVQPALDDWADTRAGQVITTGLMLAGFFVALSPWIVGFGESESLAIVDVAVGTVVAALGVSFAVVAGRTRCLVWLCLALGAWMTAAVWVVSDAPVTTATVATHVSAGLTIVVLNILAVRSVAGAGRDPNPGQQEVFETAPGEDAWRPETNRMRRPRAISHS